jgi:hypothetical protein
MGLEERFYQVPNLNATNGLYDVHEKIIVAVFNGYDMVVDELSWLHAPGDQFKSGSEFWGAQGKL